MIVSAAVLGALAATVMPGAQDADAATPGSSHVPAVAAALPLVATYKVAQAKLDVIETGAFESKGTVSWEGEGHQHENLAAADPETPSLPSILSKHGGAVVAPTETILDGHEKLIDETGVTDPCTGTWGEEKTGGVTVKVEPVGRGMLKTNWELPNNISSIRCGLEYSLIAAPKLKVGHSQRGHIGDHTLTLVTAGKIKLSSAEPEGTLKQELRWSGKVVLERSKVV